MKDLIDEKNRQEKMKRSIIKYWNVSYGSPEAIGGLRTATSTSHWSHARCVPVQLYNPVCGG